MQTQPRGSGKGTEEPQDPSSGRLLKSKQEMQSCVEETARAPQARSQQIRMQMAQRRTGNKGDDLGVGDRNVIPHGESACARVCAQM